jgi:hypothetical protein
MHLIIHKVHIELMLRGVVLGGEMRRRNEKEEGGMRRRREE